MPRRKADAGATPTSFARISDVRKELGYPDQESSFNDDTKSFRKKFITSGGQSGLDFYDWRQQEHEDGLEEMTDSFLRQYGSFYFHENHVLTLGMDEPR